jgi:hypothetical protein
MTTTTTDPTELDLSAGAYIRGVRVSQHMFLASTMFQQLRTVTRDPDVLQPGSKRGSDDPAIADERAMHELIQRALAGNKKSNALKYQQYIAELVQESASGGISPKVLPPMHLWSAAALDVVTVGATTYILVPNGEHLFAIDGETQLTAHHALVRSSTWDADTRALHLKYPLGAVIHHGIPTHIARQYFHDLNILAVRPNVSLGLSMDTQDPIMKVVGDVEAAVEILAGRVEKMSRQLPRKSDKLVTLQALRQMVINIAKGISGVQYGARPAPMDGVDLQELTRVAIDWIQTYFLAFEEEIADRDHTLAGSGPVLAAVGAMGRDLLTATVPERQSLQHRMLVSLTGVDWTKGERWLGIAGNFTAAGVFSVKGTKEVAYAVFNALTDESNPGYSQIRTRADGPVPTEVQVVQKDTGAVRASFPASWPPDADDNTVTTEDV